MLGKSGSLFSTFCNILNPEQKTEEVKARAGRLAQAEDS